MLFPIFSVLAHFTLLWFTREKSCSATKCGWIQRWKPKINMKQNIRPWISVANYLLMLMASHVWNTNYSQVLSKNRHTFNLCLDPFKLPCDTRSKIYHCIVIWLISILGPVLTYQFIRFCLLIRDFRVHTLHLSPRQLTSVEFEVGNTFLPYPLETTYFMHNQAAKRANLNRDTEILFSLESFFPLFWEIFSPHKVT